MALRLAFMGFRHGHIFDLYARARAAEEIEVVAACEEDEATRRDLAAKGTVAVTHERYEAMLDGTACDAVAVGDCYGRRGQIIIEALARGLHVISDKPVCIRPDDLAEIARLTAEKKLRLGCMLDLRDSPVFMGARAMIRAGEIGPVHAVTFGGQHPLLVGVRPSWYFEPGMHGGTINDIAIHAIDLIPWMTGLSFAAVNAARSWNAFASGFPHFRDAGQMMLTMENGAGVLGDVSYFLPDSHGYTLPLYWRMTFFGRNGIVEISAVNKEIWVAKNGETAVRTTAPPAGDPGGYLRAFLADVRGESRPDALSTAAVLSASRIALAVQKAADENMREVPL